MDSALRSRPKPGIRSFGAGIIAYKARQRSNERWAQRYAAKALGDEARAEKAAATRS